MVDEAERSLLGGLSVLSQMIRETRVVLGGGCREILVSCALNETVRKTKGQKVIAVEAFAHTLGQIPLTMQDTTPVTS